jgi:hypothetical protein
MDKQFMRLVQFIWRFRDLAKWKIPGLGLQYPFKQILAVQFDYDGKTIMQRSFVRKDKRIFGLYNTNSLIRAFPRLDNVKTNLKLAKVERKRMKFLLPLGIVFGLVCAFLLYKKIGDIGKPKQAIIASAVIPTPTPPPSDRSVNTTKQQDAEKKKNEGAYDIYEEEFRAWNGSNRTLRTTEGGWYEVGEMSAKGYVTAISDRRVRIAQPDGRTGWIVATRSPKDVPPPLPSPSATPAAHNERVQEQTQSSQKVVVIDEATPIPHASPTVTPSLIRDLKTGLPTLGYPLPR